MDDFTPNRPDPRLARAVRDRLAHGTDACPDAEQIAAWTDGALDAAAASRLEAHLADCARCQSLLAAFAATDEAAGLIPAATAPSTQPSAPNVVTFIPRRAMKWALPLAAGLAATLIVWTMTRNVGPDAVSQDAMPTRETVQAGAQRPAHMTPAPAPATPPAGAADRTARQAQGGARAERDMAKAAPGRQSQQGSAPKTETFALPPATQQAQAAVPPPAGPPPPPPPATIAPPPPAILPGARMDAVEMAEAKPIAQFSSIDPQSSALARSSSITGQFAGGAGGRGGAGRGGGAAATAAKPAAAAAERPAAELDVPTYWRILPGNRLERSRDSGLTWTTVKIDGGLPAITTGVAPAGSICWLVGARGLVLLSTNATSFTRVSTPAEVDLVSVQAVDAMNATVTAADGRTFTTDDGGKSWKQQLQLTTNN